MENDSVIADIIKTVGTEFKAIGEGFGPSDSEVSHMSNHYHAEQGSAYFVAILEGEVVGGGGIAPFSDDLSVCELRKLFLLPKARGLGIGQQLLEQSLVFAKAQNYQQCYLDTLATMTSAIKLYEKQGFTHLEAPLAGTIHNGCDVWMVKEL